MASRAPIKKSVRFAVLLRDGFKCRYCGAEPPDVVLHLDHVVAVANGGTNDIGNLVTACLPCNIGKGVMVIGAPGETSKGKGAPRPSPPRPRVEFFWFYDYGKPHKPLIEARCIEGPDWDVGEQDREWRWSEYFRYCRSRDPHFSTHGWSGDGFSPHEAAMYAAELVHARWVDMHAYVEFIDDLILMRAAGHLPGYIAPFVLRGLHPEVMHSRCDRLAPDYEEIGDNLALQAIAAFKPFLEREHDPWRPQR